MDSQLNYHFFSVGWVSWMHPAHLIYRYGEIRIISHLFLPSLTPSSDLVILDYVRRLKGKALCRAFSDKITTKTLSMNHFNETATWNLVVSVFSSFTISIFCVFRCSWYPPRNIACFRNRPQLCNAYGVNSMNVQWPGLLYVPSPVQINHMLHAFVTFKLLLKKLELCLPCMRGT